MEDLAAPVQFQHRPGGDRVLRVAGVCEANQDRTAAHAHFLEAYAGNIDYRDVAERIRALKS